MAEVVSTAAAPSAAQEVVAADAPHAHVVVLELQQGGAVGIEARMGWVRSRPLG